MNKDKLIQELIALVDKKCKEASPDTEYLVDKYTVGYALGVSDAIDLIKQHDPWISVEDRLPEEGVMVLCFNAEYVRPYFVASWCPEEGWFIDVDGYVYVITHWMPLPEPPKQ